MKCVRKGSERWTLAKLDAMAIILLVVLAFLLMGALPAWPHSRSWGYYPSGGLGAVLVVVLVLMWFGRI